MQRNDALSELLRDCENRLGWNPGPQPHRARALHHRILTSAMVKYHHNIGDLQLALAYAVDRRIPIDQPIALMGLINRAKTFGAERANLRGGVKQKSAAAKNLDVAVDDAIAWENLQCDDTSEYWITRLIRASGPARASALEEWVAAGRGEPE